MGVMHVRARGPDVGLSPEASREAWHRLPLGGLREKHPANSWFQPSASGLGGTHRSCSSSQLVPLCSGSSGELAPKRRWGKSWRRGEGRKAGGARGDAGEAGPRQPCGWAVGGMLGTSVGQSPSPTLAFYHRKSIQDSAKRLRQSAGCHVLWLPVAMQLPFPRRLSGTWGDGHDNAWPVHLSGCWQGTEETESVS